MGEQLRGRKSSKVLKDFRLVDAAISGDEQSYTQLFVLYKRSVYQMLLRMVRNVDDAEDITIESFFKAFHNLDRFKKEFTFSTWLFRIATNNAIDFLRKKKLKTLRIEEGYVNENGESQFTNVKDVGLDPQEEAIREEKKELIQSFVNKLPPKYRRLMRLRYFDEFSYEEIAVELDTPLGTIKAQLYRARELMYNLVGNKRNFI